MTSKESRFGDPAWLEALDPTEKERLLTRFASQQEGIARLREAARGEAPLFPLALEEEK